MALSLNMRQFGAPSVQDVFANARNNGLTVALPSTMGKKSSGGTTLRQAAQSVQPAWGQDTPLVSSGAHYSTQGGGGTSGYGLNSSGQIVTVGGGTAINKPVAMSDVYPNMSSFSYTTPTLPDTTAAPYTPPDPFKAPAYDEAKVQSLAQQIASPTVRNLRQSVAAAQGQSYANPNVKAMTLRQALQGYGSGLESAVAGAQQAGRSLYNQEYGIAADEAKTNFNIGADTSKINYQAQENLRNRQQARDLAKWEMEYNALRDTLRGMGLPAPGANFTSVQTNY